MTTKRRSTNRQARPARARKQKRINFVQAFRIIATGELPGLQRDPRPRPKVRRKKRFHLGDLLWRR